MHTNSTLYKVHETLKPFFIKIKLKYKTGIHIHPFMFERLKRRGQFRITLVGRNFSIIDYDYIS